MSAVKRLLGTFGNFPILGPQATQWALRRKFGPRAVTPTKARNFVQYVRDTGRRAIEVDSLPYMLNLDTSNRCNLSCPFCPTGTGQLDQKNAHLSLAAAKKAIDAVKDHALAVRLHNWGEPFLNPAIFEIIRYASTAGLFTIASTNFSLKRKDLATGIASSGLDLLLVSLDGLEQETFQAYRRDGDLRLVLENISQVLKARTCSGRTQPEVRLLFHVFRHNEHELPKLEPFRRRIGADSVEIGRSFVHHRSFIPRDPRYAPQQELFSGTCDFLYSELTVEADGSVSPCCTNTSRRWNIGTVDDLADLKRFWNSPVFQTMRAFVRNPRRARVAGELDTLCRYCRLVGPVPAEPNGLSPLPPSFVALGITYNHGLDIPAETTKAGTSKTVAGG